MPLKYSIKDLERLSGIKAHTLRMWEQRYDILCPERTDTNIRCYSNYDLKRILNISLLNSNGYKISSIAKLSNDNLLQEVEKVLKNYLRESNQVENLVMCLVDMDEDKFEEIVNTSIQHFGFESTVENIIFPFLRHMGNMWQVGIISSAQEHYISNLVRQKLIVGIDKLNTALCPHAKTYLFFLPNQELHELALLYTFYLTRARGHKCLYMGQSLPLEDLVNTCRFVAPDYLVSIFTANLPGIDLANFLKTCSDQLPQHEFLISGRLLFNPGSQPVLPSARFKVFADFCEYRNWI